MLDKGISVAEMGEKIFQQVIEVASGKLTKTEELGHGEFALYSLAPPP
jgi:altronate dehydratase